jgi:molybdopterin-guanine dinucleotide biosynthesis protein A
MSRHLVSKRGRFYLSGVHKTWAWIINRNVPFFLFFLTSAMMTDMNGRIRCGGKPMTVIVLAGGRGRRMNADKARLPVPGGTLLEHVLRQVVPLFDEALLSISPGQEIDLGETDGAKASGRGRRRAGSDASARTAKKDQGPRLRIVRDEAPGQGPMAGILAGLKAAHNNTCAVVACDIPDVDAALLRRLALAAAEAEIAVPVTLKGDFEPLFAIYRESVVPKIERLLRAGERSLIPLFGLCRTARLPLGGPDRLRNLNTRRDYEDYLRSLRREEGNSQAISGGRTGRRRGSGR